MTRLSFSIPLVNAATVVILSSSALVSSADDWPVYRGPAGTGISKEAGLRDSGEATVAWKAEVGLGYSAPIISGGKVVISGHDGAKKDTLFCFDEKTGAELWQFSYEQPLGDLYFQGGTTGTATFDGDKILSRGSTGRAVLPECCEWIRRLAEASAKRFRIHDADLGISRGHRSSKVTGFTLRLGNPASH